MSTGTDTPDLKPRSRDVTDGMERTDDPNHMGLMQGTHSFWKFIK